MKICSFCCQKNVYFPDSAKHNGYKLYKYGFFLLFLPLIIAQTANCLMNSDEGKKPEFVPYEYQRIRNKRFPWGEGQKSLFHNPHTNALPGGYEEIEEPEVETVPEAEVKKP